MCVQEHITDLNAKNKIVGQVGWSVPLLPATQEVEAGGLFDHRVQDQPRHHSETLSQNQSVLGNIRDGVDVAFWGQLSDRWADLLGLGY